MKTIKIIDLLIRCLEKDETLPKEIKFRDKYYFLRQHADIYAYYRKTDRSYNFMEDIDLISKLNKEVEIIEEEKETEKLDYKVEQLENPSHNESLLMNMIRENKETINKLIEELKRDK